MFSAKYPCDLEFRLHSLLRELKNVWGGWDMVKVHAISHYKKDIVLSGTTYHYSSELFENLHQKVNFLLFLLNVNKTDCAENNRFVKDGFVVETNGRTLQSHTSTKSMRESLSCPS